jgi:hypothetical protein
LRPRVGFVWKGNPLHVNDHNRSVPFNLAKQILELDGFEFHVLQKDLTSFERASLSEMPDVIVHSEDLQDFADTAAIIFEMDVIVTVDTVVAHLAGALGSPVWLMLPFLPDFRWMLQAQTPWYPMTRLFRQSTRQNWCEVIDMVSRALQERYGSIGR